MKQVFIISILLFIGCSVLGQIEEMINPSDLKQQTIITEPATLQKGFFRAGLSTSFGASDRIFDDSGNRGNVLGSSGWFTSWTTDLTMTYGLFNRLQLTTEIPYRYNRIFYSQILDVPGPDSLVTSTLKTTGSGLADISFGMKYQILQGDQQKPSLSASVYITLPTGRKNPENIVSDREFDMPVGEGETKLNLNLQYRQILYPYSFTVFSSFSYYFEASKIFNPWEDEVRFKTGPYLYLSGSINVHLNDWIALITDIAFGNSWPDEFYGTTDRDLGEIKRHQINYQPGLVFQIRRFRFYEIVQLPVFGRNVSADPNYILGLSYTF